MIKLIKLALTAYVITIYTAQLAKLHTLQQKKERVLADGISNSEHIELLQLNKEITLRTRAVNSLSAILSDHD